MSSSLVAALVMALAAFVAGLFAPRLIATLPEPVHEPAEEPAAVDSELAGSELAGSDLSGEVHAATGPPVAPPTDGADKVPYTVLAQARGLGLKIAIVSAVVAGSIGAVLGPHETLPVWWYLAVMGTVLSYIDWRTRLLPFRLVAPSYGVVLGMLAVATIATGDVDSAQRAAISWFVVYAIFTLMWIVYRRGIGYGDVRLSGILAMSLGWLGVSHVVVGFYSGFVLGAVIGIVLTVAKIVDRKGYPFGPFLFLGTWIGAMSGPALAAWFG